MAWPTYPKHMRDAAKRDGRWLVTVDFVTPTGSRNVAAQGPMTKAEAKVIADAYFKVLSDREAAMDAAAAADAGGGGRGQG